VTAVAGVDELSMADWDASPNRAVRSSDGMSFVSSFG
jgi:hypothetical protein